MDTTEHTRSPGCPCGPMPIVGSAAVVHVDPRIPAGNNLIVVGDFDMLDPDEPDEDDVNRGSTGN